MMQLIKNEMIKIRAQKSYVAMSCIVLVVLLLFSFITSVAPAPIIQAVNYEKFWLTESAAFRWANQYAQEHPDGFAAKVVDALFSNVDTYAESYRKEAEEHLADGEYGQAQESYAYARFYDYVDEKQLPDWVVSYVYGTLPQLYCWEDTVQQMVDGRISEELFLEDYQLSYLAQPYALNCTFYIHYEEGGPVYTFYNEEIGYDEPIECTYEELVDLLYSLMPEYRAMITECESAAENIDVYGFYQEQIVRKNAKLREAREEIAFYNQEIELAVSEEDRNFYTQARDYYKSAAADIEIEIAALEYLRDKEAEPYGRAYSIAVQLLPYALEERRDAAHFEYRRYTDEDDLFYFAYRSQADMTVRVMDQAIDTLIYAYENDAQLSNLCPTDLRATYLKNLSFAAFLITFVAIMLASLILSREFSTGTIRLWVIRPKTRTKLLGSKIAAVLLYITGMMFASFLIVGACALLGFGLDMFFFGESSLFLPDMQVVFGKVVPMPGIITLLWAPVVMTLPIILYAMVSLLISVLTKKSTLSIVVSMLVLMFAQDIQMIMMVLIYNTGALGNVFKATVLPYLSMDALFGSAVDHISQYFDSALEMLFGLRAQIYGSLYGVAPQTCSTVVGAVVLLVHIVLITLLSLLAFKRTQIKS